MTELILAPKDILQRIAERDQRIATLEKRKNKLELACSAINQEVCQELGKALGYPWFKDDPVNFPNAAESDGVCVGEHVAESIAVEAAKRIATLEAGLIAAGQEIARMKVEVAQAEISVKVYSEGLIRFEGNQAALLEALERLIADAYDVTIGDTPGNADEAMAQARAVVQQVKGGEG